MEILNTENDVQAPVVEVQEAALEQGGEITQNVQFTEHVQSRRENASFRKMRLENEQLRQENERLRGDAIERKMMEDLHLIRAQDPTVESLESLGEEFAALIAAGVSASVAFQAIRASAPPTMGALSGGGKGEKTYYSPAEVDALSTEQLADESIWARVRESMTKWK